MSERMMKGRWRILAKCFGSVFRSWSTHRQITSRSMSPVSASVPTLKFSNGVEMPIVGFGTWQANEEELEAALDCALSEGYRHIDTAYVYQNEHTIGKVLKKWLDSGKVKREELFIVTKLPNIGNRASQVEKFLDLSLSKLQLDYVDLYLIHTPFGLNYHDDDNMMPMTPENIADLDLTTDLVAIWKKMEEQVEKGKVKSIGVSNFNAKQVEKILDVATIPPVTNQVELHLYNQQTELQAALNKRNVLLTGYSSLGTAGTVSFLKKIGVKRELPNILSNPVVQDIAKELGKTPAQVLLRHIVQRGIATIPKSTNPERIKQNIDLFRFELNSEHVTKLDALNENVKILDFKDLFKKPEHENIMSCKINITSASGFSMPALGYGTWQAKDEELETGVQAALEAGYRLIDTACIYENEHVIGKVLERWFSEGNLTRDDIFITTKLPFHGNRPDDVEKNMDMSLEKLQLSYVDLYLVHGPFTFSMQEDGSLELDLSTDLVAVWKEMEKLVDSGKAKAIGVSNFNQRQVEKILKNCRIPPVTNQIEHHVYLQQPELVSFLKKNDILVTAYSPFASRGSSTTFQAVGSEIEIPDLMVNPVVVTIAAEHNKSPAQVLLRHIVQNGHATVPKSTNPERIKENIDIFDFNLSASDMKKLNDLDINSRVFLFDFKNIFKGIETHPEYPF